MAFTLPLLDYDYDQLEPSIDTQTMEIHHLKHHQGYVNKLNAALEKYPEYFEKSTCDILRNLHEVPEDVRESVRNNGGGHCNHSFFWKVINPNGGGKPIGYLAKAIDDTFGSFSDFQNQFETAAASRFGSGWAWLVIKDGKLEVMSTANQDSPLSLGYEIILGLDVWEHAYYLHYQNRRPDYIKAFWNIVDWEFAETNYSKNL